MTIPDYETMMLPLLKHLADGKEYHINDLTEAMSECFSLDDDEKAKLLPSGKFTYIKSRTGWAKSYMKQAGLLQYPRRGYSRITDRGKELLSTNPATINNEVLSTYPEFLQFRNRVKEKSAQEPESGISTGESQTPEEAMEESYQALRVSLSDELLDQVRGMDPFRFEKLVVELLISMGYGSSLKSRGFVTKGSNDEGIDGLINEDKLGLDKIYIQAKRFKEGNNIGRPEVQKFSGALDGQGATKGVFITTSGFTADARTFVENLPSKTIVLIDGKELSELMIDSDVAVSVEKAYQVKKIDMDYFVEDI